MNKNTRYFPILLAIIFSGIALNSFTQNNVDPNKTSKKLAATWQIIRYAYVDSIDEPDLVEDAIIHTLKNLDPHSTYIAKKDLERANESLEGSFEGIGVSFQIFEDTILVIAPIPGGPSHKLGIMAGDKIVKIDGEEATGVKINNKFVFDHLRGEKGSTVDVSIFRKGREELIEYTITRDKIPIHSIDATFMADKETGYIKLNRFSRTTMEEFHESVADLKEQGMKNLILDLRGNSGGYLDVAVKLSDEFLPDKRLIVYTEGLRSPKFEFNATRAGEFEEGKLIVMINEGSASASEIVSGAVQDWDRGIVIGRRSFGKGLVQRPFNLPDGSVIRLTTARYHTPSGRCIQRPYEEGAEEYYKEVYKRLENGELADEDNIDFPDSLKYNTAGNRTVYGGGGIMPDIFVPYDSNRVSDYYSDLIRKGIFNSFTLQYVDQNRDDLIEKYPEFDTFKKKFDIDKTFLEEFKEFAEAEGLETNEEEFESSENFIKYQIKALVARNVWDLNAYFQIITNVDDGYLKAMETLKKDKLFNDLSYYQN